MSRVRSSTPPLWLLYLSFFFSGAGTLLLGPTLPVYAQRWGLHDSALGFLLSAQFCGLFSGSLVLFSDLRRTLLCGYLLCALSLSSLAVCALSHHAYLGGLASVYILGFGLGQATTAVNILTARRYPVLRQRSAKLSLLNFSWSAGAIVSPLVAGLYLSHAGITPLLFSFAPVAALLFFAVTQTTGTRPQAASRDRIEDRPRSHISSKTLMLYLAAFLLYGGFEATVSGWLSTYTLRYSSLSLADAAYCTTALWVSLAVCRAAATPVLRFMSELTMRIAGLLLAVAGLIMLRFEHSGLGIAVCCGVMGIGLAPFVPLTFSLLIGQGPSARQAGVASAQIGLGSALFTFLTGLLATRYGSLQTAMLTPVGIGLCLVCICFFAPRIREPLPPDYAAPLE